MKKIVIVMVIVLAIVTFSNIAMASLAGSIDIDFSGMKNGTLTSGQDVNGLNFYSQNQMLIENEKLFLDKNSMLYLNPVMGNYDKFSTEILSKKGNSLVSFLFLGGNGNVIGMLSSLIIEEQKVDITFSSNIFGVVISNSGKIALDDISFSKAAGATPTPLPSAIFLFGSGIFGIPFLRKFRV